MRILTILVTAWIIPAYGSVPHSAQQQRQVKRVSAPAGRDDKADQVLRQMHEKSKKLTTVQSSIVQVKYSTEIGGRQTFAGYLYFKHEGPNKDKVRITYKNSGGEVTNDLLIDGDKIILYQPKIKQAIISSRAKQAEQNPEYDFLAAPYGSVPNLKSRYTTAYLRDESIGSFSTSVIQLTPTGKSSFTKVTFWVDQASWFPVQYRVDETNGDVTTLTLSDIKRNGEVRSDAFNLNLPKNVAIMRR
jgi:outer membrane lipoprotein-sorting protein